MAMTIEKWDVMLTYNWETGKSYADDLHKVLTANGYKVWMDDKELLGNIGVETSKAIANSELILFLISEKYENSHYCKTEYKLAHHDKKEIMPIQVENYYPPEGSELRLYIAGEICYKLFEDKEKNMNKILMAIERRIGKRFSRNRLSGIRSILENEISSDWKKFARCTGFKDVDTIIESIETELKSDDKSKMSCFLDKLYQGHPQDHMGLIEKSLRDLERNDVIDNLGLDKRIALKNHYYKKYEQTRENRHLKLAAVNTENFNYVGFDKEFHKLLLISGATGIGKTSFLNICLLDWANESLWSDINLVFYLEFNQQNWCHEMSLDKQAKNVYTKISKDWNNFSNFSKLFIIDGLNDYSNESHFINAVAETLKSPNSKCIVAGKFRAIKLFKDKINAILKQEKESTHIASFHVTGLSDDEIKKYVKNNTINNQKETINDLIRASHFAKALTTVPFCLKRLCEVTSASSMYGKYSFNSISEFYSDIFLYFLQTHVNKPVEVVKQFLSDVCDQAFRDLNLGKASFSNSELQKLKSFNEVDYKQFETFFGNQLSNHSFFNFCASIHAYIHLSPKEIIGNETYETTKLHVCVSMICGIMNLKDKVKGGIGDYFQSITMGSNEERKKQLLYMICESLPKMALFGKNEKKEFFIECFYEAQATITNKMKRAMKQQKWLLLISDESEPWKIVQKKYFFKNFFAEKMKLKYLCVKKACLSSDEKDLIKECSTNVYWVIFKSPVKIEGLTPSNQFKLLWIFIDSNVTETDFECFYPWIEQCQKLRLYITSEIAFIKCIFEKIKNYSNIKKLKVRYSKENFNSIKGFKSYIKKISQSSS